MHPSDLAHHDVCRLVTTGRRTGRRHDIEIWFGIEEDVLYLISGNGPGADWFRNLLADPEVEVRIDGHGWKATARHVTDPEERRTVGRVMGAKYGGWGGDPDIGLSEPDWLRTVPAAAVEDWVPQ
jgi:deazaflavin-dependent oxidoreductase (nitroreductase family)